MEPDKFLTNAFLEKGKLLDEFRDNQPFRHLFLTNFLKKELAEKIAVNLRNEKFVKKDSDLFKFSQTKSLAFSNNNVIKNFVEFLSSVDFLKLIKEICGLKVSKAIDIFGSLYENTDYLLCHDDRIDKRKIAFLFYFSEDFAEEDGGALGLFDSDKSGNPRSIARKYYPKWNSFMMFEVGKKSFHTVEEILSDKKRYTVGGWLE